MRLRLIGYGSIARHLAGLIAADPVSRLTILARPPALAKARAYLHPAVTAQPVDVATSRAARIAAGSDLMVECAGQSAMARHIEALLAAGTDCLIASVGTLADAGLHNRLTSAARRGGARLIQPGGDIGGRDRLAAARAARERTAAGASGGTP